MIEWLQSIFCLALKKRVEELESIFGSYFFTFTDMRHIHRSNVYIALATTCGTDMRCHLADIDYLTVSKEEMEQFLKVDTTSLRKIYKTEYFDCDDFAFRLKGNITTQKNAGVAFFIVWSRLHAFNAFIDHDHKVWFIEPQHDVIIDPEDIIGSNYKDIRVIMG